EVRAGTWPDGEGAHAKRQRLNGSRGGGTSHSRSTRHRLGRAGRRGFSFFFLALDGAPGRPGVGVKKSLYAYAERRTGEFSKRIWSASDGDRRGVAGRRGRPDAARAIS